MTRKLAAILAADVVGYSRMIAADEAATLAALATLRAEVFGPVLADNTGSIVKSMGDGWLVEFSSAVAAVNAGMQIQDRLTGHPIITLRIGIHIGDVTRDEHDLYGDGINIAARLEGIAPEGGVTISDAVYSSLDGTLSPSFENAGPQILKNIERPVITWVRVPIGKPARAATPAEQRTSALPLLSITPTANSDPRAELRDTADALTADFGTYFGSINWLQADIRSEAALKAYTLRPVLRARGERMRLETRLYTRTGDTLWTHKSDTTLDEAFDWQDAVVAEIADHCIGLILEDETTRISAIPDDALTAEQCLLMGIMTWRDFGRASYVRSLQFHERAMIAKPDMADAYAEALIVLQAGRTVTNSKELSAYVEKIPDWIEAAKPLAPGHAMLTLGIAIARYQQDKKPIPMKEAVAQTLRMAPFDARILSYCGWANLWSGQTQDAYDCFYKSLEFGRLGPFYVASIGGAASASVQLGRDEEALALVKRGLAFSDLYPTYYMVRTAALAHLGRMDEARASLAQYLKVEPERTLKNWQATNDYGGSEGGKRYFEGMRIAGLPEG